MIVADRCRLPEDENGRANGNQQLIHTHEILCLAIWKVVIAYRSDFENQIRRLQGELLRHAPQIGRHLSFSVLDPKRHRIYAAAYPERVLHHAVMNICEPLLEADSIFDTYACRKGNGPPPNSSARWSRSSGFKVS
jgi:hypothetical protein